MSQNSTVTSRSLPVSIGQARAGGPTRGEELSNSSPERHGALLLSRASRGHPDGQHRSASRPAGRPGRASSSDCNRRSPYRIVIPYAGTIHRPPPPTRRRRGRRSPRRSRAGRTTRSASARRPWPTTFSRLGLFRSSSSPESGNGRTSSSCHRRGSGPSQIQAYDLDHGLGRLLEKSTSQAAPGARIIPEPADDAGHVRQRGCAQVQCRNGDSSGARQGKSVGLGF
jgi:hypothetical protein